MKRTKLRRCPECGGETKWLAKAGRKVSYRNMTLELPKDLEIETCLACGEQWLDEPTSEKLDLALASAYQVALRKQANEAIMRVVDQGITVTQIEHMLGLSQGYLSRIRREKAMSPALVGALVLLARAPRQNMEALEAAWAGA